MPGLAIAAASSAAWASMGAQAETAWNTGWGFDQNVNSAGVFVSNASPTSSGFTFQSTGDATALYLTGRGFKVIQVGGTTAFGTVGLSSFSGGITNVFVNQFSTAGSTIMSTGVITSVAVAPHILGVGGNFGGLFSVVPTTGGDSALALGANPSLTGAIRIANTASVSARNFAGSADFVLIQATTADQMSIGPTMAVNFFGGAIAVGAAATVATVGNIRITNGSVGINWRNAANTANINAINVNGSDVVTLYDARVAGTALARTIVLDALGHGPANGVIWGTT